MSIVLAISCNCSIRGSCNFLAALIQEQEEETSTLDNNSVASLLITNCIGAPFITVIIGRIIYETVKKSD